MRRIGVIDRLGLLVGTRLALRPFVTAATLVAIIAFAAILPLVSLAAVLSRLTLLAGLLVIAIITLILRDGLGVIIEFAIVIVLILRIAVLRRIVIALKPLLHLRLRCQDDPVVMFGVLQIIFSHDPVAGTLRIARKVHVLLGNMLSGSAYFHVGTGAVIRSRQRVLAFTVAPAAIVASATSATALVLLSWPHSIVTWLCS